MIILNVSQFETEFAYFGILISLIEWAHECRNGIWNDPICLVILSVYGSICSGVKDYEMENETYTDIE